MTRHKEEVNWELLFMRLSSTPRTRSDLAHRLKERGCPDEKAQSLLDGAEQCGIVDDRLYGLIYLQSHRDWGRRRLVDQLRLKGVSRDTIEEVFRESDFNEAERIMPFLRDLLRRGLEEHKIQARLLRRGFAASRIGEAFRQVRRELDEENRDDSTKATF